MQQCRKTGLNLQIQNITLLVITVLSSGEMMVGVESSHPVEVLLLLRIHPVVVVVLSLDPKLSDYIGSNSGRISSVPLPGLEWGVHNRMMEFCES